MFATVWTIGILERERWRRGGGQKKIEMDVEIENENKQDLDRD
jgi:hypothetical protein